MKRKNEIMIQRSIYAHLCTDATMGHQVNDYVCYMRHNNLPKCNKRYQCIAIDFVTLDVILFYWLINLL